MARIRARKAQGDSDESIALDARVHVRTLRTWLAQEGIVGPPPPILAAPAPLNTERETVRKELGDLSAALLAAGAGEASALIERARVMLAYVPPPVEAPPAIEDDSDCPDPSTHTREWIVYMIKKLQRSYDLAERTHNPMAAKQHATTLEKFVARLKQHDESQRERGDDIRIPRIEIAARQARMREIVEALTRDPPRCAACNRAIRVAWATDPTAVSPSA